MKRSGWILILVLIIASFLRLSNITTAPPGLYPDEAMNGNNAIEALETGNFKSFYPENNGREGLFINIEAVSITLFGNEPWALRIPSTIFGILTVLGIYFLAKELFNGNIKIALLSAFLLSTSFWHINFSRIAFRAIMAPFFMVWSAYFLLLALRIYERKKKISILLFLSALGGIAFGLGFHSYIAYRVMPIVFLALVPFYFRKREFYIAGFTFLLFAAIAVMPLVTHFVKTPEDFFGRTTQISIFNSETPVKDLTINIVKTMGMFNVAGDFNWRHNFSGRPELSWPTGILFLIGVIWGTRSLVRKISGKDSEFPLAYTFILLFFTSAALPVVVSNEGIPHALRAILMIPPVFILAGAGGIKFYEFLVQKFKREGLFKSLAIVLFIVLIGEAYNTYFNLWAKSNHTAEAFNQSYVEIGRELNSLPNDVPKFVVLRPGGVLVRRIPMPAQTIMFITDTFTESKRKEKNISYVTEENRTEFREADFVVFIN